MAEHSVSFDSRSSYRSTLDVLHRAVTVRGWPRRVDAGSRVVHVVTVRRRSAAAVVHLRASDLYVIGFRTSAGASYCFSDAVGSFNPGAVAPLALASGYTGNVRSDLAILCDPYDKRPWGASDIDRAFQTLGGYRGRGTDELHMPLGIMAFCISEALRFKLIFHAVQSVLAERSSAASNLRFGQFRSLFSGGWKDLSGGKHDTRILHDQLTELRTLHVPIPPPTSGG